MNKLKLYYDLLSQPSRTLYIFLLTNKVPFEKKEIRLGKGEHKSDEYKKINPMELVPSISDGQFNLGESVAIVRYLCREKDIPDHWYPKDSLKRAKVDEYLEWQHFGTRLHCALYFRTRWLEPLFTLKPPNPKYEAVLKKNMIDVCDKFEKVWLNKKPFVNGEEISVADLFAATEIEQPKLAGYDPREGRPDLTAWLDRVKEKTSPHYEEAHLTIDRLAVKYKGECPALVNQK